jgi:hypothetical protein
MAHLTITMVEFQGVPSQVQQWQRFSARIHAKLFYQVPINISRDLDGI